MLQNELQRPDIHVLSPLQIFIQPLMLQGQQCTSITLIQADLLFFQQLFCYNLVVITIDV